MKHILKQACLLTGILLFSVVCAGTAFAEPVLTVKVNAEISSADTELLEDNIAGVIAHIARKVSHSIEAAQNTALTFQYLSTLQSWLGRGPEGSGHSGNFIMVKPDLLQQTDADIRAEDLLSDGALLEGAYGNEGRLVIEPAGIAVAVYSLDGWTEDADEPDDDPVQTIVDREDSAAVWDAGNGLLMIGDHSNQEFAGLFYVQPGDVAVVANDDGSVRTLLVCTEIGYGYNEAGISLLDLEEESVTKKHPDSVVMYTCNGPDWHNVFITYWKQIRD